MILLKSYLTQHAKEGAAPPEVVQAATRLLQQVNFLLAVSPCPDARLRSGWRPPAYNLTVPNAAPNSKHMTGHAIDVSDNDGELDDWLTDVILEKYALWREHPASTKSWCHLQDLPPKSGRRTFYP